MPAFLKYCGVHAWILVISEAGWTIGLIGKGLILFSFPSQPMLEEEFYAKCVKYMPSVFVVSGEIPPPKMGKIHLSLLFCILPSNAELEHLFCLLSFRYVENVALYFFFQLNIASSFSFYSWDLFSRSLTSFVTLLWTCSCVSISSFKVQFWIQNWREEVTRGKEVFSKTDVVWLRLIKETGLVAKLN